MEASSDSISTQLRNAGGKHEQALDIGQRNSSAVNYLSGALTGSVVRSLLHPLDTVKTKMQVLKSRSADSRSSHRDSRALKVFFDTLKKEGPQGLYRGLGINLFGGAPAAGIYYYSYEKFKEMLLTRLDVQESLLVGLISGVCAEVISCIFWVPIEVVKERLQVMSAMKSYHYKGSRDAFQQILRSEGLKSMYRGYGATILAFGPFAGISLATYDKLKFLCGFDKQQIGFKESFGLSSVSGVVASVLTHPIDVVKVRLQVQRADAQNSANGEYRFGYRSTLHGLQKMISEEGMHGVFKGLSARLFLGVMTTGLHLSLNDWIKIKLLASLATNH